MDSDVRTMLTDMRASRRRVFAELEGLPEVRLTAPAQWGGRAFDARFMLLRYADHEEEHALQVRKTLDGFGWQQTEAQQIAPTGHWFIASGESPTSPLRIV